MIVEYDIIEEKKLGATYIKNTDEKGGMRRNENIKDQLFFAIEEYSRTTAIFSSSEMESWGLSRSIKHNLMAQIIFSLHVSKWSYKL